jgi:hypothetical protein
MAQGKLNTCIICEHPQREAIDRAIMAGDSLRYIATMFTTSKDAVQRHKNVCMKRQVPPSPPLPVPAYQTGEQVATAERVSLSIITRVSSLVDVLELQATECASDKDRRNMTATATALLKALELNARLTGELGPNNQVNLQVNVPSLRDAPEWPIFIRIIEKHPAIKAELNQALLEGG